MCVGSHPLRVISVDEVFRIFRPAAITSDEFPNLISGSFREWLTDAGSNWESKHS